MPLSIPASVLGSKPVFTALTAINWYNINVGAGSGLQSAASGTSDKVTAGIQGVALAFAGTMFAWGGILYQVGSPESIQKAKHRWIGSAVGLVVVVGAKVIASFFHSSATSGFG